MCVVASLCADQALLPLGRSELPSPQIPRSITFWESGVSSKMSSSGVSASEFLYLEGPAVLLVEVEPKNNETLSAAASLAVSRCDRSPSTVGTRMRELWCRTTPLGPVLVHFTYLFSPTSAVILLTTS